MKSLASAAILLLVGTSTPIMSALGWPRLADIGRLSAASVNPVVFNQVGGIEFWANEYVFVFQEPGGEIDRIPATRAVLSRLAGPHTRKAAFVVPIGLAPIISPSFYVPALRFGMCDHGPLSRALGYRALPTRVSVEISSGSPNDDRSWSIAVSCTN